MDENQIIEKLNAFNEEHPGMENIIIYDESGAVEFILKPDFATDEERRHILDVWKNKGAAIVIGENRYPVLKWDDIQFVARNVLGKGAIIGSMSKTKKRVILLYTGSGDANPISIYVNRWAWELI